VEITGERCNIDHAVLLIGRTALVFILWCIDGQRSGY
jgi:hypothetical protein